MPDNLGDPKITHMQTIHLISHTHWDREWYRTYQQFRLQLINLIDKLLEILDRDNEFCSFLLDGQAIILDDYLEIRPERKPDLERLVKSGRLFVGPWYVSPDEYLISPESHIRNLLAGDRICQQIGGKMLVGYLPDTFGHIGQMPQILRGFGIDTACMWRGLDDQPCELEWVAPDGSGVLLSYLRDSYSNAASLITSDNEKFRTQVNEQAQSLAPYSLTGQILLMYGTDHMQPSANLSSAVASYQGKADKTELIISNLPHYFGSVRSTLSFRDIHLQAVHGELRSSKHSPLLPNVLSTRIWLKQRNFSSENDLLKWVEPLAAWAWLIDKTQVSDDAINLPKPIFPLADQKPIIDHAWKILMQCHPHDSICGTSLDQVHDEMRVRFDQVDQISHELITQGIQYISDRIDTQSSQASNLTAGGGNIPVVLTVFNANDLPQSGLIRQKIMLVDYHGSFEVFDDQGNLVMCDQAGMGPKELISMKLDKKALKQAMSMIHEGNVAGLVIRDFKLTKQDGTAFLQATLSDHAQVDAKRFKLGMEQVEAMLADPDVDEYIISAFSDPEIEISMIARDVPPHGYRCYYLREINPIDQKSSQPVKLNPITQALLPIFSQIATYPIITRLFSGRKPKPSNKPQRIENEYFIVEVKPGNSGIKITDKRTGQILTGMNQFVDGGDCGDLYNYCSPNNDTIISSHIRHITRAETITQKSLVLLSEIKLPKELSNTRKSRSKDTIEIPITSTVTLFQSTPRIDIHTEIENHAHDHRLRVHFPTTLNTDHAHHDGHFEIVRRSIGIPAYDSSWEEPPRPEVPQRQFTAISDERYSLTIANRGLPEVEVLKNEHGNTEIAVTLLRCVGWLSRDDLTTRKGHAGPMDIATPGAQLDGRFAFDYSIIPGDGHWSSSIHQATQFNTPLKAVTTSMHSGTLPLRSSLVECLNPEFIITSIKNAEDCTGVIVRGYNCLAMPIELALQVHPSFRQAQLATLDESSLGPVVISDHGTVDLNVEGHKIITLKLFH